MGHVGESGQSPGLLDGQRTLAVEIGSLAGWHRHSSGALWVKALGKEPRPGGLKCAIWTCSFSSAQVPTLDQ